jgi:hypothetical protein
MKPKDEQPETKTLKTVRVNVKRGNETIVAEVFPHELQILRAMHPYENVNVTDANYGELTLPDDADLELRRLQAKYDRKNLIVVARVYRTPQDVAQASGLAVQAMRGQRAPASGLRGTLRGSAKQQAAA